MKKKKVNKKNYLVILLCVLVCIFLIFLLIENIFLKSSNYGYKKVSHINDVKNSVSKNDTDNFKTVGWIDIFDTNMSMPIFHIKDGSDTVIKIEKFAWTYDNGKLNNFMTIYGHNIMNLGIPKKNGKDFNRFEELMNYVYLDFAKNHKYFQVTLDGKDYVYKIFSVAMLPASDIDDFPVNGAKKNDMEYTLDLLDNENIYKYGTDVNEDDDIAVLTTCTRMYDSLNNGYYDIVVAGRKIRDKEKIKDYSISKSKKYETIDKIVRGEK